MEAALRYATPTAQPPSKDASSSEGRHDPHGIAWTRGAPPFSAHLYASADFPKVMADESKARKSDSNGDGTGIGRRASGYFAEGAGTLVFVDGAGNTETWNVQAGEGQAIEMISITSWTSSSSSGLRVFW